ncbi:Phosphoenolpyruvate carboxylase family protein [Forsythia ovata]|uniref:Phosphoenolpyruvate carboxylase family protein n=1 Tax=Forsythia ovata TaxID=205694 RepID=A0ABD1W290_9LAMI
MGQKALDLGPQGLIFSMIDNPDLAQQAVSYCRYPPNGIHGAAHPIVRASKYGIDEDYLTTCENDLFLMCQVESMEGIRNVKEIAAVDGVDCIQIGPLDLSANMGQLLDPVNDKVKAMMSGAEEAVIGIKSKKGNGSNGPYLAGFAMQNDGPNELRARGYNMLSGGVDIGLYRNAALDDVKRFKMGLNPTREIDRTADVSSFVNIQSK